MKTKTICENCIHREVCLRKVLTIKPLDECHFRETEASIAEPCLKKAEDIYQKGLDDAWACARKIMLNESDGGLPIKELDKIFAKGSYCILTDFSASEAIEKIKKYEEKSCLTCKWDVNNYRKYNIDRDKKEYHCRKCFKRSGYEVAPVEDEIKVGDEVSDCGLKSVVVRVCDDCIYTVTRWGTTPKYDKKHNNLKKTGRHFSQIVEVLEQMKKENNNEQ